MPTFYKTLNSYDCIQYIAIEWERLTKTTMVNCWQKMFDPKQLKGLSSYQYISGGDRYLAAGFMMGVVGV